MRYLALFILLNFSMLFSAAQDNESDIKKVINNLFNSMRASDPQSLLTSFHEGASLKSILKDSTGKTLVKDESISDFAASVSRLPKGYADERILFDAIKIDGDLAFVWTPYDLYFNGKFIHCGVDAFVLLKLNDQWKISSLIDTRRKQGCNQ
jgi:hypothetical protein